MSTITLRVQTIACVVTLQVILVGCATTGQAFPSRPGEAPAEIRRASALIRDAVAAGADSLAPEPLAAARQHLAEAEGESTGRYSDRAPMTAHQAAADATYAKALAQCVTAERMLHAEEAALAAVPLPRAGAPPASPPPAPAPR